VWQFDVILPISNDHYGCIFHFGQILVSRFGQSGPHFESPWIHHASGPHERLCTVGNRELGM
jgi:hypothetical protein